VPKLGARAAYATQAIRVTLMEHKQDVGRFGDDMLEITGRRWVGRGVLGRPFDRS
jgi:hypothetical protein